MLIRHNNALEILISTDMGKLTLCQRIQTATKQYMLVLRYFLGSVYLEYLEGVGGHCDLSGVK